MLGSSFFFLFAISAVIVGFIANRVQAKHTLLVMALIWALVQFPMLFTASFGVMMASRILLGAGEGPAAPVATHAIYKWFPDSRRGLPTAILAQGSAIGVIVAVPILSAIIKHFSWHWAFGALGIAGLLWSVAWLIFGREGTLVDPPVSHAEGGADRVPYRYLLTCPASLRCAAPASPAMGPGARPHLVPVLHDVRPGAGRDGGPQSQVLPWLLGAAVVLGGGYLSQRLKSQGVSSRMSRGVLACATVVLGGCILPFVAVMPTPALKIAVLVFGGAIGSTVYVVLPMIVSELTPQPQRAGMLAITTSIVTFAGVLSPAVMGLIIQHAATPVAGYEKGYVILGLLLLAAGIIGLLFIRPEADRKRLAARAVANPPLGAQPARA